MATQLRRAAQRLGLESRVRVNGRVLRVPTGVGARSLSLWSAGWKVQVIEEALRTRDGSFVDVGANVGQTLMDFLACSKNNRYVGYEPIPECADYLRRMTQRNALHNVRIRQVGLGEGSSKATLLVPPDDSSSASVVPGLRPGRRTDHIDITCVSLDSDWDAADAIAMIKIDIEGGELAALLGMTETLRRERPPVLCEVLDADSKADPDEHDDRLRGIESLLAQLDYSLQRVRKPQGVILGLEPLDALPRRVWTPERAEECDYLFLPR